MATDLNDPDETRSFLVPAYEFAKGSEARDFDPDYKTCVGPVRTADDAFRIIHRDDVYLHPRASREFMYSASALYNTSIGPFTRPFFIRLQEHPAEKPAGVRSRCLMIEGRRLAPRRQDGKTELVPAYAAWNFPGKHDAKEQRWIKRIDKAEPWVSRIAYAHGPDGRVATKTIESHWNGQGALCAIMPDGMRHLLLLEFHVFDDDPHKADLLKILASRHELGPKETPALDPTGAKISQPWLHLIARAERGSLEECGPPEASASVQSP